METFDRLKAQLAQEEWPNLYFFKFIVPSQSELIAKVSALFDEHAEIHLASSKKGKYTSISAKIIMMSADSIIEVYEKAAKIDGVISL